MIVSIFIFVSLLEHRGKDQPQASQCSSPWARKSGACACDCVHFHLSCRLRVLLGLAHASKQQQTVVGDAESSSTQRQQPRACGVVDGSLSPERSVESPATGICRDVVSETEEEIPREHDIMYGWCGPTRYPFSAGLKAYVSFGAGTIQNWCLVSSDQAISVRSTENISEISAFL